MITERVLQLVLFDGMPKSIIATFRITCIKVFKITTTAEKRFRPAVFLLLPEFETGLKGMIFTVRGIKTFFSIPQ